MATLLTELYLLDRMIILLEVSYKNNRYIATHERRKSKKYEGGQLQEILSLIVHKVEENDKVLKEIKENVSLLNK